MENSLRTKKLHKSVTKSGDPELSLVSYVVIHLVFKAQTQNISNISCSGIYMGSVG